MKALTYLTILIVLLLGFSIIIKRHHYVRQADSCLYARKIALKKQTTHYIPQCTLLGHYFIKQCKRDKKTCFCVNKKGGPIANTQHGSNPNTDSHPACTLNWFYEHYRSLQNH